MPDHETLQLLELAERDAPICPTCAAPTVLAAHGDGSIWLQCPQYEPHRSTLRHVLAAAGSHYRREILTAD
jgi:ribosomal protein S27AE